MRRMAALVLIGIVTVVGGCGPGEVPEPQVEPAHKVSYSISASGTANENLKISYAGPDGAGVEATSPGTVPFWSTEVTTKPGVALLFVQGNANSSDLSYQLTCTIKVDGVEVVNGSGPYSCATQFELSRLPSMLAEKSPSAGSGPTTPAAARPSAPATPSGPPQVAGCGFVEGAEVSRIVSELAGVSKPVQKVSGNRNRCTYVLDYDLTQVTMTWRPGDKAEQVYGAPKVSGLGVTAYWADLGSFGILEAQLPKGAFNVQVDVTGLNIDLRKFAIGVFKAAKPRLPK
ncbi:hypothetical protein [Plantactinospora sp. BC1]|uniref:hypothetical protein n=1 Tax=Plantactinospora sp. BC1 TaxID=2108470 RepID=UPI00131EFC95|nr:hypothetical protein [Plantactinospora sp. BC1]